MILSMLRIFEEFLSTDQGETEAKQLKLLLTPVSTPTDKEATLSLIRNQHERALAKIIKHLREVTELSEYFARTPCERVSDEQLEKAALIFESATIRLLTRIAEMRVDIKSNGDFEFDNIATELNHLIFFSRTQQILGKYDDLKKVIEAYPFNIWT